MPAAAAGGKVIGGNAEMVAVGHADEAHAELARAS